MAVLTNFFCKMYFLCVSQSRKKSWATFFWFYPLKELFFSRRGIWLSSFTGRGSAGGSENPLSGKVGLSINYGCPNFHRGSSAGRGTSVKVLLPPPSESFFMAFLPPSNTSFKLSSFTFRCPSFISLNIVGGPSFQRRPCPR